MNDAPSMKKMKSACRRRFMAENLSPLASTL
jgi:hypothetical protein